MGVLLHDLSGMRFGRLIACWHSGNGSWKCQCDCGAHCVVPGNRLRNGNTRSCGCLAKETLIARNKATATQCGMSHSKEYKTWSSMMRRCYDSASREFYRYGKRGISVCNKWRGNAGFKSFFRDMGASHGKTLERINNNGNYNKSNCRWATRKEQARNTRQNRIVQHNGQSKCLAQWCEELELPYFRTSERLRAGWSVEKAFFNPPKVTRELYATIQGKRQRVSDWCRVLGIKYASVITRIRRGETPTQSVLHFCT